MTFKEFLMEQYIESERPLDDMIPDGFNDWLDVQDIEDVCDYAEEWKKKEIKKLLQLIEDVPWDYQQRLLKAFKNN